MTVALGNWQLGRAAEKRELKARLETRAAAPPIEIQAGELPAQDAEFRRDYIRQVRLAQGKETERIERVWLLEDAGTPDAGLIAEHPGLIIARAGQSRLVEALPPVSTALDHIYVIDPLGNLMMRFPPDPDPRHILKDVSRLLRHSKWK